MKDAKDDCGCPYPLGATVVPGGINFSIFSASARRMQLVLFNHPDDRAATRTVPFDPVRNRTSHYWHIFVSGIKPGQLYGYRADGPIDPAAGQRFDPLKVLIDPYGKGVSVGRNYSRAAACVPGDNASTSMKSVVADLSLFDWEGDRPINRLFRETVIYEMHVAGFTRHPSSGLAAALRGTYLGIVGKIRCRTSACIPVRFCGRTFWAAELLGLRSSLLLCAASCVQHQEGRSVGVHRRVSHYGEGSASGGY
jgi:glycogen operon protein